MNASEFDELVEDWNLVAWKTLLRGVVLGGGIVVGLKFMVFLWRML